MDAHHAESIASASQEPSVYQSFGSTSATLSAASSPGPTPVPSMTSHHITQIDGPPFDIAQGHPLAPFSTLAQISYAPATQTTIVTTTKTVTTSYPPMILPPPRNLTERDPKQYPLAASPTPQAIQELSFTHGGRPMIFRESGHPEQTLQECNDQYAALHSSKGVLKSIQKSETQYETPNRPLRASGPSFKVPGPLSAAGSSGKKRSAPPHVSIAEAAEIASLERRTKKTRGWEYNEESSLAGESSDSLALKRRNLYDTDDTVPATPDTDAGSTGQFKIPRARVGSRRATYRQGPAQRSKLREGKRITSLEQVAQSQSEGLHDAPEASAMGVQHHSSSGYFGRTDSTHDGEYIHALNLAPPAGISATPPIAESDLEPIEPYDEESQEPRPRRPTHLDTSSVQDASLPSPSLSPITAAANLAQPTAFAEALFDVDDNDDANEISSLDLSRAQTDSQRRRKDEVQLRSHCGSDVDLDEGVANPQLLTPASLQIPGILDAFDAMPDELKTYVMYQLLRRCSKTTLHFVADVVNPALKCDFLDRLPAELSLNIVRYFDAKTMCRAAQVSKKWRQIINSDEKSWKTLLEADGFELPPGEVEKAVREGWGWQFPHGPENYEVDLSRTLVVKAETETSPTSPASQASYADSEASVPSTAVSTRPKRKAAAKFSSNKRQRRKGPSQKAQAPPEWMRTLEQASGPNSYATAAALAIPNPNIGLPSLQSLHLFKSLYQRHHLIRKSWMQEDNKPLHIAFKAHQRHVVTCLQFDTDKILTGSDDTNINVYDTKTGALRDTLVGHEGGVWALQYDGNTLVSGSTDRSVRVWDIEKAKCTHVFQGHTSTVRCLVILQPSKVGEASNGEPIMMPKEPLIITGSRDSSLRVWRLPKPGEPSIFQTGPPANDDANPYFIRALTGHHHSVRAIAAHGDTLVSGSYDSSVRVWKISTGEVLHRLTGHTQKVYSVVLDHQRARCISGSMDNLVKVWSLETGACLFNLEGHASLVGLLDLSHDRLVSAAADSTLRIWDPETGQCKSTLSAHTGAITCFQHDGQKVISGSDRTLKMWDVRTGECVRDLLTDLSGVWQVKFNERRCVAAVQRHQMTHIEVLDFGAVRDGIPADRRGRRILVDSKGNETTEELPEVFEVGDAA